MEARAYILASSQGEEGGGQLTTGENQSALRAAKGFGAIFELVKAAVQESLGAHRAGLTLVLGDIPNNIGAYHEMGSNAIVMNRNLLRIVERLSDSRSNINSYIFMILLHEYLHALGIADDGQVRNLSRRVTDRFFGAKHPAAEMAVRPLDQVFPELPKLASFRDGREFETVDRFDLSSTPYIG